MRYYDIVGEALGITKAEPPRISPFDKPVWQYVVLTDDHGRFLAWWDVEQKVEKDTVLHFEVGGSLGARAYFEFKPPTHVTFAVAGGRLTLVDLATLHAIIDDHKEGRTNGVSNP